MTVATVGGRVYRFAWEPNREYARNLALNLPFQGTAAEIAIEAMIRIAARLRADLAGRARLVLQVHDEFVIEVEDDLWGEPTDRKHRPAAQFVAGSIPDYGDDVLLPLKGPKVGAVLIYPMAVDTGVLPPAPEPKDIVLAVAWIAPLGLKVQTSKGRPVQGQEQCVPRRADSGS
jgi:DNA polymerase family A